MNAQHRINRLANRYRRVSKRIGQLTGITQAETIKADLHKREIDLELVAKTEGQIMRLILRGRELETIL